MPMVDFIPTRSQDEGVATYFSQRDSELLEERQGFTRAGSINRELVRAEDEG